MSKCAAFENLLGKTLVDVVVVNDSCVGDSVTFFCSDGTKYKLYHYQGCCESVYIEDICGQIDKLKGLVLLAEENTEYDKDNESGLYTFYRITTNDAQVTIRWYGDRGYYSVDVSFIQLDENDK